MWDPSFSGHLYHTTDLQHTHRSHASLIMGRAAGLLLVILAFPGLVSGFNLDTTDTLNKEGEKDSFFGFSLALHQQLSPELKSWVLVGAPRARGLGTLRNSHPGALYRCPITAEEYDCERVDIDGDVRLDRESKDNQWLGVTVKSQGIGGKVVTCAHLYELRQRVSQPSETRDPVGRCYMLSEDLTERDDLDGGEWKFCEGRPQGHEQFGFCQQGLAASFTPDNNYILFGAPGTYNWKGEMRVQLLNQTLLDLGFYDDGPYEVADEKQLNATLIPVPYHSYLGFSVDSAKGIMNRGELTFVAGAPRANHTGAVVLLKKDNIYRLVPEHILWGEELASSFGYSVTTADLNHDGWTDLIVGAPNFFDRKAEIGGAVYVFLNPASHWEKARPIRLNGTYDSMFGMTVSSIGDLDQDGYGDVAIGAPFDGAGKVFIFRGSATGINTKPSQVLDGLNAGVSRFGYSISGGLDIDGNLYPDLAVGSLSDQVVIYRSRPVVHVIRDISMEPQHIDLALHNCKGEGSMCVEIKACYTYTAHPDSYSPHITLNVHFEADTERRKLGLPHRVHFFGRTASEAEYVHSEEVELKGQKHPACQTSTFAVQENIRDKLRPISLAITHTIKKTQHHSHVSDKHLGQLSPVLGISPSNTFFTEVNFLREGCGDDKICQSNLKLSYQFGTRAPISGPFTPLPLDEDGVPVFSLSDQKSIVLEVTVTNMPSDPENPQEDGDDAHAAQLLITLPNTLSYSGFRGQQVVCQANQNGSQADCELGNPVKRDTVLTFYIILSTSAITIETTSLSADLLMSTISEQPGLTTVTAFARVVIELPLAISGLAQPHQLFFSGTVIGESAMKTVDDVGSEVQYEFTVSNTGHSTHTLGSAFLNIMWPHELANGKWLLYPSSLHVEGQPHSHCTHLSALNPRGLRPSELNAALLKARRKTRSHPEEEGKSTPKGKAVDDITPAVAASDKRKSLKLDCLLGSARCVLFQCPLHSFSGTTVFKVKGHLWNSTFLEEFSSVSVLELLVRANITVKSSLKHLVLRDAAAQVSVMIYPEHGPSDQYSIPWWIILIAFLAGILVLALLVCILWKCGFFQRAHYKDKVPQYHAVKIPRQERSQFQDKKSIILNKKEWVTHWSDGAS
ncbi:integrin alpha-7 isoform X2 [Brachyhypopomus gauderio]|uniref:integrin alpha-7 isoform X2 n=1 Tax=Brachyhypopomus gauderio TaxID=698409 RepID=UPI0040433C1C